MYYCSLLDGLSYGSFGRTPARLGGLSSVFPPGPDQGGARAEKSYVLLVGGAIEIVNLSNFIVSKFFVNLSSSNLIVKFFTSGL